MLRSRATACALIALLQTAPVASAQTPPPLHILRGNEVFAADSGEKLFALGLAEHRPTCPVAGDLYTGSAAAIDLADPAVLTCQDGELRLRRPDGKVLWQQRSSAIAVATQAAAEQLLLLRDVAIAPGADGGLVALTRDSGELRWRQPAVRCERLLPDGDLVFAIGTEADKPVVAAVSPHNGAFAFTAELPGAATLLAASPRGVAVAGTDFVVCHDRAGPQLFRLAVAAHELAAGPDCWAALATDALRVFDREGRPLWSSTLDPARDAFVDQHIAVAPDGSVVLLQAHRMADSGLELELHAARTGEVTWRRRIEGLGIAHSKYWQRTWVLVRGDRVVAVSQAAGGDYHAVVELANGALLVRSQS